MLSPEQIAHYISLPLSPTTPSEIAITVEELERAGFEVIICKPYTETEVILEIPKPKLYLCGVCGTVRGDHSRNYCLTCETVFEPF
jgi:hypothetical protein